MVDAKIKQMLWKSADKLRAQMDAAEYKHIVLGLIFLKYISDNFVIQRKKTEREVSDPKSSFFIKSEKQRVLALEDRDYYTRHNVFWVPKGARWEDLRANAKQSDIGVQIDSAMTSIEKENSKALRGKLDKRFGRTQLEPGVLGELIDLISTIGFDSASSAKDLLGEVYEYFLGHFASAEGKKGGQFYTPSHIVRTLVAVLSPHKGRVYDPCCGSGGMFVQSEEFVRSHGGRKEDISIYGQESNPTTWRLAAMNIAIRGFGADLGKGPADTFANDQFPDKKFDYILANPPFNISDWGGEKYDNDPRWKYGRPPPGNANFAWLQHILWKLSPGGLAGVVLANGSMSSTTSSEGDIREAMVRSDVVEVMIALPSKLFLNTQIPVCLWFLTNDKRKNGRDRSNQTLFIDARSLGQMETRALRILGENEIEKIGSTVGAWRSGRLYQDEIGYCKSANLDDITKHNFILTPGRYVGVKEESIDDTPFDEKIQTLTEAYRQIVRESQIIDTNIIASLRILHGNQ